MTVAQFKRQVATIGIVAGSTEFADLPKSHYLGALEFHIDATVTDSSAAAITVVDATLGAIPIIDKIQLVLDGTIIPLNIRGEFLDYWSHVDRPGSERFVITSTTSGAGWDAVLRYELAQSIGNLTGAIPLHKLSSARLEVTFGAVGDIATSANTTTVTGNVIVVAEMYSANRALGIDESVVHTLREYAADIAATGETNVEIPAGRQLERMLIIAENNALYVWTMLSNILFRMAQGDDPYSISTEIFRSQQLRVYGSDDIPITGLYVFDFRQAAGRDIVPLGDLNLAPDPELVLTVPSGTVLTNARVHVVMEELQRVGVAA